MKRVQTIVCGLAMLGLLLVGCDEGGVSDAPAPSAGSAVPGEKPGEVVVEPSAKTLVIDGEERDATALVTELLTDGSLDLPLSYHVKVDEAFDQPGRVRFWVEPEAMENPAEAERAADEVFEQLAEVFVLRTEAALRGELVAIEEASSEAADARRERQTALSEFQAARRGLAVTNESRQQRIRLGLLLDQAVDRELELSDQAEALRRAIQRQQWATLRRTR